MTINRSNALERAQALLVQADILLGVARDQLIAKKTLDPQLALQLIKAHGDLAVANVELAREVREGRT